MFLTIKILYQDILINIMIKSIFGKLIFSFINIFFLKTDTLTISAKIFLDMKNMYFSYCVKYHIKKLKNLSIVLRVVFDK